ncbi:HU family DNA-binding protein [Lutibacter profundi]|uniref:HU family DNA-binding protein n=1 Tax=Lutibacter profundi TaxID=1622118 RepID=UPI0009EB548A|nr:HU family DNA-binding protein [Lutibacter profundi]
MNKGELVDAIAKDANLSKADAKKALNAFESIVSKKLNTGKCIKLIVPVAINKRIKEGGKTIGASQGNNLNEDEELNLKRKRPGRTKYSNITLKRNQVKDGESNGTRAINHDASRSNNTNSITAPESKGDGNDNKNNGTRAINHDASRSNNTNSITAPESKGDGNDDKNNGTRAINHDASRNNNTNSIVAPESKGDGNGNSTTKRGKRKAKKECLENGGSFWESSDGSYHCMMKLSTSKQEGNTTNELFRSKKRKCFKAGGKWVTNSHGSFCWNPSQQTAKVEVNTGDNINLPLRRYATERKKKFKTKVPRKNQHSNNNLSGYTTESTMIFVKVDETSLRQSNTKIHKDNSVQDNDKRMSKRTLRARNGYRERVQARTLRTADKRYRDERVKARTLRTSDKRYRAKRDERVKARTLRTRDKRYSNKRDERVQARTLRTADKRYRERIRDNNVRDKKNTIQNKKPIKITTKENNKVIPSNDLDTRYLKVQNYQTIQISKSKFQLTAPLLISKNQTDLISYNWTVKNKTQNKVAKFTGETIHYNFDVSGTYEIEITPVVNHKNLNSYHISIICN